MWHKHQVDNSVESLHTKLSYLVPWTLNSSNASAAATTSDPPVRIILPLSVLFWPDAHQWTKPEPSSFRKSTAIYLTQGVVQMNSRHRHISSTNSLRKDAFPRPQPTALGNCCVLDPALFDPLGRGFWRKNFFTQLQTWISVRSWFCKIVQEGTRISVGSIPRFDLNAIHQHEKHHTYHSETNTDTTLLTVKYKTGGVMWQKNLCKNYSSEEQKQRWLSPSDSFWTQATWHPGSTTLGIASCTCLSWHSPFCDCLSVQHWACSIKSTDVEWNDKHLQKMALEGLNGDNMKREKQERIWNWLQ